MAETTDSSGDQGAFKIAGELRPFVPQNTLPDGSAEELQLVICRKLREVSARARVANQ